MRRAEKSPDALRQLGELAQMADQRFPQFPLAALGRLFSDGLFQIRIQQFIRIQLGTVRWQVSGYPESETPCAGHRAPDARSPEVVPEIRTVGEVVSLLHNRGRKAPLIAVKFLSKQMGPPLFFFQISSMASHIGPNISINFLARSEEAVVNLVSLILMYSNVPAAPLHSPRTVNICTGLFLLLTNCRQAKGNRCRKALALFPTRAIFLRRPSNDIQCA